MPIPRFDWPLTGEQRAALGPPPADPYILLPQFGLNGRRTIAHRFRGMEGLLARAGGATVLDCGAAEGALGLGYAEFGARLVHGFDVDADRVAYARRLFGQIQPCEFEFRAADLSDWAAFERRHGDLLLPRYDIALFCGLYHNLPDRARDASLRGALRRAGRWLGMRTHHDLAFDPRVIRVMSEEGFALREERAGIPDEDLSWMGIYERLVP